jgi:hypothetical protein
MPDREPSVSVRPPNRRIEPEDVQNPLLCKAFDLWKELKGTRRFPERGEVTPRNMSDFLRNIVLVRIIDGGTEFEFRIVGDAIVMAQGEAFRGLTTAQIDKRIPGYGKMLNYVYRGVAERGMPTAYRGWFERADDRSFFQETLILPLGPDGGQPDHILIVAVYAFDADGLNA